MPESDLNILLDLAFGDPGIELEEQVEVDGAFSGFGSPVVVL